MSKEIKVHIPKVELPLIPEINIQFLNGNITIPSRFGGYVVAPGCGSGKTTAIKDIIKEYCNYGIVYSAFTINECNEMYRYCRTFLPENDVVVLHSNYTDEGVDNNMLRNNPEGLSDKKVIICTHYKLLNEYPEIFQSYNRNIVRMTQYSKIRRKSVAGIDSNGNKKYPRQLIIVDEMPTCQSLSDLLFSVYWSTQVNLDLRILIFSTNISIKNPETKYSIRNKYENSDDYLSKEFKLQGLDNIIYPKSITRNYKSYNLVKLLNETKDRNSISSRSYHLQNRSTQEKFMDLLIRLNYFKVKIYKEIPFICNNEDNLYYLVDYYIPECNLIIELDSDYHDDDKDSRRDEYFKLIGIKIIRLRNFEARDEELKLINESIEKNKGNLPISINYHSLTLNEEVSRLYNKEYRINKTVFRSEDTLLNKFLNKYGDDSLESNLVEENSIGIISININ